MKEIRITELGISKNVFVVRGNYQKNFKQHLGHHKGGLYISLSVESVELMQTIMDQCLGDHHFASLEFFSVTKMTTVLCFEVLAKFLQFSQEDMTITLQTLLWEATRQKKVTITVFK